MILGITLARGGSKGVPRKNIRPLGGRPLLEWTIDVAVESCIDHYFVSTDDDEIAEVAWSRQIGCIWRPPELAQDDTPTLPALQDAVLEAERACGELAEFVIELRCTGPFKTAGDVNGVVEMLRDTGADSVIGVSPCEHPARIKYLDNGRIRNFYPEPESGRRQDLKPTAYVRNGTIYGLRRAALFGEIGRVFGHADSRAFVMASEKGINIDTELDFAIAEALVRRRSREPA